MAKRCIHIAESIGPIPIPPTKKTLNVDNLYIKIYLM